MALHVNNGGNWVAPVGVSARVAGAWTDVQEVLVKQAGAWVSIWQNEALVVLTSRSTSVDLRSLFDATTWASARKKRVLVPAGVTINSNNWLGALYLDAGTAWGGDLVVDIGGSLYGIGGVYLSNSGEGGAGIGSAIAGASGQRITVNLLAGGIIKAGGGAGGLGGAGGAGSNIYASYDSGFVSGSGNSWLNTSSDTQVRWAFTLVGYLASGVTQFTTGSSTYYRGSLLTHEVDESGGFADTYTLRRVDTATGSSTGGSGGYGGRGQGSDGASASGSSGSAGGTNAGTGGAGGSGGAWGSQGGTGSTGAAGNAGSGAAGAAGGLGGRYAYGWLTINNAGAVAGRLALS